MSAIDDVRAPWPCLRTRSPRITWASPGRTDTLSGTRPGSRRRVTHSCQPCTQIAPFQLIVLAGLSLWCIRAASTSRRHRAELPAYVARATRSRSVRGAERVQRCSRVHRQVGGGHRAQVGRWREEDRRHSRRRCGPHRPPLEGAALRRPQRHQHALSGGASRQQARGGDLWRVPE